MIKAVTGLGAGEEKVFNTPLYFEDFEYGLKFKLPPLEVTEDKILKFGLVTGDRNSLHTNEDYAKTTVLKGMVAHGRLVVDMLFGVLHQMCFWDKSLEALLESHDSYKKPVRPGDEIFYTVYVLSCVSNSQANKGRVLFQFEAINQSRDLVAVGDFTVLIRKRVKK